MMRINWENGAATDVSLYNKVVAQDILDKQLEDQKTIAAARSADYFNPEDRVNLSINEQVSLHTQRVNPVNTDNSSQPTSGSRIDIYV